MDGNNMNNMGTPADAYTYAASESYGEVKQGSNALAVIALICGILSLLCCGAGVLPGIAGLICGIIGKKKCPKAKMALTGMILSIIGIVLGAIVLVISLLTGGAMFAEIISYSS